MIFTPHHRTDQNAAWRHRYAVYELIYTAIDFGAAVLFVIGSIMFFLEAWVGVGTWLFLIGSILFACKPTLRLVREVHLARTGAYEQLAQRAKD